MQWIVGRSAIRKFWLCILLMQVLSQVSPDPNEVNRNVAVQYPQKNRSNNFLPCKYNIPVPCSMHASQFIHGFLFSNISHYTLCHSWQLEGNTQGRQTRVHQCLFCQCKQVCIQFGLYTKMYLKVSKRRVEANAISIISFTAGLQAVQGVHRCTGPNERHLSWFLEDGVWEGLWVDCDAIRPCGGWRGTWTYTFSHICVPFSCLTFENTIHILQL